MYDLKNDPLEITNLWDDPEYLMEKTRLLEAMVTKMTKLHDRAPLPEFRA